MKRPLTDGECEVLELLEGGNHMAAIARDLNKHKGTVNRLAVNAYVKLGVRNRYDAVHRHKQMRGRGHVCGHLRYRQEHEAAI